VPTGAVVVGVDRSTASHPALRWATAAARRSEVPLCVLTTATDRSAGGDRSLLADVRAAVGGRLAALPLLRGRSAQPVVDRLRTLSAQASMVVVPAALPGLTEFVAASYSPVVVVPERDAADGPVVLGAAPWTGDEVFELAFREAAQRRTGLIAVRTQDHALERARDDLDLALSPWTVIHPGVRVERMVVPDQTTALLLELSTRAPSCSSSAARPVVRYSASSWGHLRSICSARRNARSWWSPPRVRRTAGGGRPTWLAGLPREAELGGDRHRCQGPPPLLRARSGA
jgi:hypothetical protein